MKLPFSQLLIPVICAARGWMPSHKNPQIQQNPLLKLPQVIATPHLGAQTDGATSNMGWLALQAGLPGSAKRRRTKFRVA